MLTPPTHTLPPLTLAPTPAPRTLLSPPGAGAAVERDTRLDRQEDLQGGNPNPNLHANPIPIPTPTPNPNPSPNPNPNPNPSPNPSPSPSPNQGVSSLAFEDDTFVDRVFTLLDADHGRVRVRVRVRIRVRVRLGLG